jgi:hypothetical protein
MTFFEVLARTWNHMADVDWLAGLGIGHQAVLARFMLKIENLREGLRGARERRMRCDVADLVIANPDLARALQPHEEFLSGSCTHRSILFAAREQERALIASILISGGSRP